MTSQIPAVAEGARLAIALTRAWEAGDQPAQLDILKQVTADKMTANVLLAMTALLSNAVALCADQLQVPIDDMWASLLALHGEPTGGPT